MSLSDKKISPLSGIGYRPASFSGFRKVDRWEARPLADSVLHLIWREKQISRAEIARQIGLSRSTVTEVIRDLLNTGYVKEVGAGVSSGGRKPIVLEFQNDHKLILGIDIGATHVSTSLMNLGGELLAFEKRSYSVRSDPEGTRSLVFQLCDTCLDQVVDGQQRLLSIGVALPSPIDPDHPEWVSEVVIPAWRGKNELDILHNHYDVPVYVDNDANLGALAEYRWGSGRGFEDLTYVKIGYGLGAGFVLNGEIYRGSTGIAGEMGHMTVGESDIVCECGLEGCLSTLVGGKAMLTRVAELSVKYPDSPLANGSTDLEAIEAAALENDELALQLYQETTEYLSTAITGWINMMNPSRVIIGGTMMEFQNRLLDPVQEKIKACSIVGSVPITDIRTSELGHQAESIGAATLALESVFSEAGFYRNAGEAVQESNS
ncbi:MAG: ROK family transcriptional regulator [FCB group bacterium]|nr:ROK family transcriptional regulator [FCB group bacterium]MBL7027936.1 ROK family transcriptional regulator [Candidatus Neomarinimicrobiota bacterium]MBL7121945.1 ROK family transcriptional regulator [Candidatus Neomarinimicrobiota bacterium]